MIAGVYESPGGDYAPIYAQSVFDFNQMRLNRIYFDMPRGRVEIETHLVGWLVTYAGLIKQAKNIDIASVETIITVSGDKFKGTAVNGLNVTLCLFDIGTFSVVENNLNWKEAILLHGTVLRYIKDSLITLGVDIDNISDMQLVLI